MEGLVGDKLTSKDGPVDTETVKSEVVALYFSASWCGPCQSFTPMLIKFYEKMRAAGKEFEVIFVSSDRDENSFNSYYKKMPWLAIPFEKRDIKAKLSSKLKVQGIPTLAFVNGETGEVYEKNGRAIVMQDSEGAKYPWVPPTLHEALGTSFIRNDGTKVSMDDLKGKYIGLYFSASWCGPCVSFTTPVLKPVYEKLMERSEDFEVIFISSDQSQGDFDGYFKKMPWLAIPFGDPRKQMLSSHFEVEGIPTMILLDKDKARTVLNKALRGAIMNDPEGEKFPWIPEPVQTIEEGAAEINDMPAMVLLMEKETSTTQAQFEEVISELAATNAEQAKKGKAEKCLFLTAKSANPIVDQIRNLTKLKTIEGTRTLCNGDMCLKLDNSTAVAILDIPDQGGFYVFDGEITKDNLTKFFQDFQSGALKSKRKQLG